MWDILFILFSFNSYNNPKERHYLFYSFHEETEALGDYLAISPGHGATERNPEEATQSDFYYTTLPLRAAGVHDKYWKLKLEIPEGSEFGIFPGGPNWPWLLFSSEQLEPFLLVTTGFGT